MSRTKKILVVGMGMSGCAAARFLIKQGFEVCAFDDRFSSMTPPYSEELMRLRQAGVKLLLNLEKVNIREYDQVVVSPGVPQTHSLYQQARLAQVELIGEAELAMR